MARVAPRRRRRSRCLLAPAESEVGPLLREPAFILNFRLNAHDLALIVTAVVDRSLPDRTSNLQNEHSPVGPTAALEECAIGRRVDEHVIESRILRFACGRSVGHSE